MKAAATLARFLLCLALAAGGAVAPVVATSARDCKEELIEAAADEMMEYGDPSGSLHTRGFILYSVCKDYFRALEWTLNNVNTVDMFILQSDFRSLAYDIEKEGDMEAQEFLGDVYFKHYSVIDIPQSYVKALKLYRLAAEHGSSRAQVKVDELELILERYVEKVATLKQKASQGEAEAQYKLGLEYGSGKGIEIDATEAAKWHRLAAEQGHEEAQYRLGLLYKEGEGVAQDYTEAVKWHRLAAEQGHEEAQYRLGLLYKEGEGVVQDYTEAVKWHRLAAEQGHEEAHKTLEVIETHLAAEQGDVKMQNHLGEIYYKGESVAQNYREAFVFFALAAANGDENAAKNRAMAEKKLTPEEIILAYKEAAKRFKEIKAKQMAQYVLFALAAAGGDESAAENRIMVEKKLTPEEIILAYEEVAKRIKEIKAKQAKQ